MPILLVRLVPLPSNPEKLIPQFTGITAPNVSELFSNIDHYTGKFPSEDRVNLYYTVADCHEGKTEVDGKMVERQMRFQEYLPIDIDDCEGVDPRKVAAVACKVLNVEFDHALSIFSGHGVQILIQLQDRITDKSYFDSQRVGYGIMCDEINRALKANALLGPEARGADRSIWSNARLMRLPGTINRKKNKPDVPAFMINNHSRPYPIDLNFMFGVNPEGHLGVDYMSKHPEADTEAILKECSFIHHARDNAGTLSEPDWYKAASIMVRMPKGRELFHEFSKQYSGYSFEETENKLNQAMTRSGPATCARIHKDGHKACETCPHFGKITSPINIKGADFIASEKSGFYLMGSKGQLIPQYEDLKKFFNRRQPHIAEKNSLIVYGFNGQHLERVSDGALNAFCYESMHPRPQIKNANEFRAVIKSTNQKSPEWFRESVKGLLNMKNGVLDLKTKQLLPHSKDYAFQSVFSYAYDESAKAPQFETFLDQITLSRADLKQVILEFMGYCLASADCWAHKAILLIGGGSNGKSELLSVVKRLVSEHGFSAMGLKDLQRIEERQPLFGKLVNISEETPSDALIESSVVKDLISGGDIPIRERYHQATYMKNRAKLMFACNSLPAGKDFSDGFFRRLLVIPFDFKVNTDNIDAHIGHKLATELPGILNLCLQAYDTLWHNKSFSKSQTIEDKVSEYRNYINDVRAFMLEHMEIGTAADEHFTTMGDIYDKYKQVQDENRTHAKGKPRFFEQLKEDLPNYKARIFQKRFGEKRLWSLRGIKLVEAPVGPH